MLDHWVACSLMTLCVSAPLLALAAQPDLFGASGAYERFMGRWSRLLAPALIQFAGVEPGQAVLDVGSGTGALAAAALAVPRVRVTGVDPSDPYVTYAASRLSQERSRFLVGDAQSLDFPDRSFDRAVSLLVLNFIPDARRALREMIRVTKPNGIVAAAVWDYGDGMEMLRVFWDEAVRLDPTADARDERHMPLSHQGELSRLWREASLQRVDEQPIECTLSFASFDDYWEPFLGGQGPAGAYVASLREDERQRLRGRVRERLLGQGPDRPFTQRARAWAVRGVVP